MAAGKRYKWQGSTIEFGTGFAPASPAVTITAITKADPMVITATNTFDEGDVVRATGIVGMTELNERIGIVTNPTGTTFEIDGIDSTSYAAYVSGGTVQVLAFADMCELTAYNRQGGTTAEIDATTICSEAVENEPGLQDFGTATMDYNFAPQTTVQESIQAHADSGEHTAIRVTLPTDGGIRTIEGWVQQTSEQSGNGQIWKGNMAFRVTGRPFDQEAA
ncbi:MAG: phage tail tube protein [Pararhizobium sp.]